MDGALVPRESVPKEGSAPETTETLIRLEGISKNYVTEAVVVRALRSIDLSIQRGEFIAIVGTSGSGKSTLMNIVGCLDRPTTGTYHLAGLEVGVRGGDGRAIVRNRLIGFIFQGFNLLSRTSALENVELPLQYRGVSAKERRARAKAALEAVGLGDRLEHTPNQLSGGQQQRVAIARALVTDPPLLLADEPTGNLDTRTSYEVLALLQRLNRERGITIALVTHEPDIARCASRVVTFRDGRIESDVRHTPLDAKALLDDVIKEAKKAESGPHVADEPKIQVPHRLRMPVTLPLWSLLYFAFGATIGVLYDLFVLGSMGPVVPVVLGLLADAYFSTKRLLATSHRKRSFGHALDLALIGQGAFALMFVPLLFVPGFGRSVITVLPRGNAVLFAATVLLATVLLVFLRVVFIRSKNVSSSLK